MAEEQTLAVAEKGDEIGTGAIIPVEDGALRPDSLEGMWRMARYAVQSRLVPVKTAAEAIVIMQRGAEMGFPGYSAFEFLYPVDGKPRLTPQGAKAIALKSGLIEDFKEELIGDGENREAIVTVKRRGVATQVQRRFSLVDARRAGLAAKTNWKSYPDRMLLARARGYAFMDAFPDVCGGLQIREQFDLDPGEAIGATEASPVRPKTGADPIFGKLGVKVPAKPAQSLEAEYVSHADTEIRQPFPSHAEADKAIADSEKQVPSPAGHVPQGGLRKRQARR